jgi:hypothetical protein
VEVTLSSEITIVFRWLEPESIFPSVGRSCDPELYLGTGFMGTEMTTGVFQLEE